MAASGRACTLPDEIPYSHPNSTRARQAADSVPTAFMATDVLQQVAFKTWPVSGELLYGSDASKKREHASIDSSSVGAGGLDWHSAASAAAAAATSGRGKSACGCSWNCDTFFVSDYGERLVRDYGGRGNASVAGSGEQGVMGEMVTTELQAVVSYKACCAACRAAKVPCKIFAYDEGSKQCNLTTFMPKNRRAGLTQPGISNFGLHFVCGKCPAAEAAEVLREGALAGSGAAGRDAQVDCSVERSELSAVGIALDKQRVLCNRFRPPLNPPTHKASSPREPNPPLP